nr:hypothetical protein [Pyrinomonadaceae bacterium]
MQGSRHVTDYEPVTRTRRERAPSADEAWSIARRPPKDRHNQKNHPAARSKAAKDQSPDSTLSVSPAASAVTRRHWLLKRGHALSYAGLFLFSAILYFRPYELISGLSFLSTSAYWVALLTLIVFVPSQLGVEGNLTTLPREVTLIALLCLIALTTMPLAISPADAWKMFNETYVRVVLMFIVMVNVVRTEWRLKGMILLMLAATCLLSGAALNDYRVGNLPVEGYRVRGLI